MRSPMEPRDQALISVLAYAGLRPQEALALRFEDIGDRSIRVHRKNIGGVIRPYTKTRTERYVRLLDPRREDLEEWQRRAQRSSGLLFPRPDGQPFREDDYRNRRHRRWESAAERRVGLVKARPYDLRATWVSLLIFEGHTVLEVAPQAGHSAETCLCHYARVFDDYDPSTRPQRH